MIKEQYKKELALSAPKIAKGNKKKPDIYKIQSWLNLYSNRNPASGSATSIDGDYGPSTERAVMNYQKAVKLPVTGVVDTNTFNSLCAPMRTAFTTVVPGKDLRQLIVNTAQLHLNNSPFELVINEAANSGPWVRAYMDGNEGEPWYWCMGFVQTIIDQAASQQGKNFKTLMPLTYSCDIVGAHGLQKNLLTRNAAIRKNPLLVKPGDIFLVQKSPTDWIHTGIVTAVYKDIFETIEGNTNTDGSHNGNGVFRRTRNFMKSNIDVFSVEPLVAVIV